MKLSKKDFDAAVSEGILSESQSSGLFEFLKSRPETNPAFSFTNLLYYFGGMIAIGAMTIFMNLGWERFGGWGIFSIALTYSVVGIAMSGFFERKFQPIPAGICATFVVALVPLAIYGLLVAR